MLRRVIVVLGVLVLVGVVAGWLLTAPHKLPASELAAGYHPDLANGKEMFNAGNCSACHMAPGQTGKTMCVQPLSAPTKIGSAEKAMSVGPVAPRLSNASRRKRSVVPRLFTHIPIRPTPAAR